MLVVAKIAYVRKTSARMAVSAADLNRLHNAQASIRALLHGVARKSPKPTTVARLNKYVGRLPTVRFGSTETCLQVMGTPLSLTPAQLLVAFERGWKHAWKGELQTAYYIGREHPGFTEVRVVRNVKEGAPGYLEVSE